MSVDILGTSINAEARFNNSLRPRKPECSLGRTAQDVHLDSHTAPELYVVLRRISKDKYETEKATEAVSCTSDELLIMH